MTRPPIELRMLGPLEGRVNGVPVPLGGPKQRALLALLLLHANDVVPLDRLIEELWDGSPAPSAPAYVQNCVSRLRKAFGADALETRPPGYRLRVDPDAVDASRFERLVREAHAMPARERASALRDALGLWKGSPLSDLAYWSFAQDPIRRLEEQRLNALELRLEAELEVGMHRESIGELDALAREHPTHERLRWLQMLALHRSDRRLDALTAYQEARLAIVEESGMEPGEELRALHRRILQDDPTLMPGGAAAEVAEQPAHLARKVVTVCIVELVVDGALDVEATRGVVSRGLASLEEIVLRHGGTVEQLLGEEAVVVFGLSAAHEDDVLRALRATVELRDALGPVSMRAAVETGEVLVGENGRLLSGGALTTARRVKEGAAEGEILLGPAAAAQTAGAAWAEPSEGGHRLVELVEGASAIPRRPDAPLVGRRAELERLVLAVRECTASSSCRRVVVLGEPGIGKTRLAAELVRVIEGEARVLTGRCVPYADGATYVPLADVLGQIADDDLAARIHSLLADEPDGEHAAARLAEALSGASAVDSGDVFWATRKLLETVARTESLVVVLEDVHWAEPTFLDLLEYLVGWSIGAPIAIVCLARPELLDARPAWASDTIALRPLGDDETAELLAALPESLALDVDARTAVVAAAEGNPLFLEQLAAHALDGPLEPGRVPASLESLLASRLDSLGPGERVVLERASVVGREFTRAAVDAVSPDGARARAATSLMALVRRRLVRPDTERAADDAFLFDHALIRDATYTAIAKAERARLHERLARWLDRNGELEEIVGHHLEQAVLNRREAGNDAATLAAEASERLGSAGERAVWSLDHRAAVGLLTRAIGLLPVTDPRALELECLRAIPLKFLGESSRALELLRDAEARAVEIGDHRLELRAKVEQVWPLIAVGEADLRETDATLREAITVCEDRNDALGVARAWAALASVEALLHRRFDAAVEAAERGGRAYARHGVTGWADRGVVEHVAEGTAPLKDAIELCERQLASSHVPFRDQGLYLCKLAEWNALTGRLGDSRDLLARARAQLLDIGYELGVATFWSWVGGFVEVLAEDGEAAVEILRPAVDSLDGEDRTWRLHLLALTAEALALSGEYEEALGAAGEAAARAMETDLFVGLGWRIARSRACLGIGRFGDAVDLASEAVELVDSTDHVLGRGRARLALASALVAAGRSTEASAVAREAERLLEDKGATLLAERARALVAAIDRGEPGDRAPLERA